MNNKLKTAVRKLSDPIDFNERPRPRAESCDHQGAFFHSLGGPGFMPDSAGRALGTIVQNLPLT
jgi:hypothetical protein